MVLELGKSKVVYVMEYAGKETTDFGKEFLRKTGLPSALIITSLEISNEDSKSSVLTKFCKAYPMSVIILVLGRYGLSAGNAIKAKGIDAIMAEALNYYNISNYFDEEVGYAIVNNGNGYDAYLRTLAGELGAIAMDMVHDSGIMNCLRVGLGEHVQEFIKALSESDNLDLQEADVFK